MTSLATRHVMQANKSKNTKPELKVRAALREAGLGGYRLHWKAAPGKPDVSYPGKRVAIFVNGCFWHRCPFCSTRSPKSNVEFWEEKFARNRARDERDVDELVRDGWTVLVVWECRLKRAWAEATLAELVREVRLAGVGAARPRAGISPASSEDVRPNLVWPRGGSVIVIGARSTRRRVLAARKVRMRHSGKGGPRRARPRRR